MDILQPENWKHPQGYSNGIAVNAVNGCSGRMVFVSGMVGWDAQQCFQSGDFTEQAKQALQNIIAVLHEGGARPEHIVRMTWYVVDKQEYLAARKKLGKVYREMMGGHFPAMTVVQVVSLMEELARVEIEVTACVPCLLTL